MFHASFTELVERVRGQLPKVRRWYVVADQTGDGPSWATAYEPVVAAGADRFVAPWGRSDQDLLLLYTGGTTGMPKGVMWPFADLFAVLGGGGHPVLGLPPITSLDEIGPRVTGLPIQPTTLVACPMMHGTGQFSAFLAMALGGAVISLPSVRFDAAELWRTVAERRVSAVAIVGQAFAGPMLDELDAHPGELDLSCVALITSSGVMWSQENKDGLLRHLPGALLFDTLGSSEAVGLGASISTSGLATDTARFTLGPNCAVFTDDGRRVEAGSGERGMLAVSGAIPLGYYGDEAKTAQTFRTYEGRRWSVPGDWAEIEADGTLKLLGRGSVCINTGGEKVFPEEVEEALKTHPGVRDAVAVGLPDQRFGERICAVVEPDGGEQPTLAELSAHVRGLLADYKTPRELVIVDTIGRAPNGKVDYARLRALAAERVPSP